MNKWLSIILILVISAGTFFPCCALDDCEADREAAVNHKDKDDPSQGNCSPFFNCAGCQASVVCSKTIQIEEPFAQKQEHYERIQAFSISNYTTSFWQPPRS